MEEEIVNNVISGATGFDITGLLGGGTIGAILIAALIFFLNWRNTNNSSSKKRKVNYEEKLEVTGENIKEIVTEKIPVKDKEIEEKKIEIIKAKEILNKIIEDGNINIESTLTEKDVKKTKNRINDKWKQI